MTLLQFQKEPFLPIPNNFLSQTQGSFCNVSNCQTHVGSDGRALSVAHGLLKHFAQPFFSSMDLISKAKTINCLLTVWKNVLFTFYKKRGIAFHIHGSNMWYGKVCIGICRCCLFHGRQCLFLREAEPFFRGNPRVKHVVWEGMHWNR